MTIGQEPPHRVRPSPWRSWRPAIRWIPCIVQAPRPSAAFGWAMLHIILAASSRSRSTGRQGVRESRGRRPSFDFHLDPRRLSRNALRVSLEISSPPSRPARTMRTARASLPTASSVRGDSYRDWRRYRLDCRRKVHSPASGAAGDETAAGRLYLPQGVSGWSSKRRSVCATTMELGTEIFLSEVNVKCSRGRDPHEVRARERFTFAEGPRSRQVERERRPSLPLISLSPCLPVDLGSDVPELTARSRPACTRGRGRHHTRSSSRRNRRGALRHSARRAA